MWQTLPLGPTHFDRSPYHCVSSHAGNPLLISREALTSEAWFDGSCVDPAENRRDLLVNAYQQFKERASPEEHTAFETFTTQRVHWLEDYALYQALRDAQGGIPWFAWPIALRDRSPTALKKARKSLVTEQAQVRFEQFLFFRQWNNLRQYANARGIRLFGDVAIFVAHDSADVWAHRECFQLDGQGQPTVVAGVPPDYFSVTGQRWGNPLYDWAHHEEAVTALWVDRMRTQSDLFDLVRIDHFRGLEAHWEIPAHEPAPMAGRWVTTPGDALLTAFRERCPGLSLVAEDLGIITEAVDRLRQRHHLPGMQVLQFGFDGDPHNRHLLHAHDPANVVYTGTHDNDTTLGWFDALPPSVRDQVLGYFGYPAEPMPWPMVRFALASVAKIAILPMQDALGLDGAHRMNTPGTTRDNWQWRFDWSQVSEEIANRLAHFTWRYDRR